MFNIKLLLVLHRFTQVLDKPEKGLIRLLTIASIATKERFHYQRQSRAGVRSKMTLVNGCEPPCVSARHFEWLTFDQITFKTMLVSITPLVYSIIDTTIEIWSAVCVREMPKSHLHPSPNSSKIQCQCITGILAPNYLRRLRYKLAFVKCKPLYCHYFAGSVSSLLVRRTLR